MTPDQFERCYFLNGQYKACALVTRSSAFTNNYHEADICLLAPGLFWVSLRDSLAASSYKCLGVIGAVVGGWLFNSFGAADVTGLNIYSLMVTVIGAIPVLFINHAITRKRA